MKVARSTQPGLERKVDWLELFYDLVLVAALSSSNHVFVADPTLGHALVALVAVLGLFLVWLLTTLVHNRFMVDGILYRALLLIQMVCLLFAAIAANPNDAIGWQFSMTSFGLALATIGLMFALVPAMIGQPVPGIAIAALGCFLAAAVCLIAAALPEWLSTSAMILALLISFGPVVFYFARRAMPAYPLHAEHLYERLGLLVLIVIGEGFLQLLNSSHDKAYEINVTFFLLVFLFNFALGTAYFDGVLTKGKGFDSRLWGAAVAAHFFLIVGIIMATDELAILAGIDSANHVESGGDLFAAAVILIFFSLAALESITHHSITRHAIVQIGIGLVVLCYAVAASLAHGTNQRMEVTVLSMTLILYSLAFAGLQRRARLSQSPS